MEVINSKKKRCKDRAEITKNLHENNQKIFNSIHDLAEENDKLTKLFTII